MSYPYASYDDFYAQFPIEERDSQGRLTLTAVLAGDHVLTTEYDPANAYDWSSRSFESLVIQEKGVGDVYTSAGPSVHDATAYDNGGYAEQVSSYQPYRGRETPQLVESQYHRYDAQGNLTEHTGIVTVQPGVTKTTEYDLASGLPSHETVKGPTSFSETDYDRSGTQPWAAFKHNYAYGQYGPLTSTVEQVDDGSLVTTSLDPSTGKIDHQFTTLSAPFGTYVATATDYDLGNQYAWSSYTIHRAASFSDSYVTDTQSVMDDGSTVTVTNLFDHPHGQRFQYGALTALTDAQGRLDYVLETHSSISPIPGDDGNDRFLLRALDYNTETGHLDYLVINYANGTTDSVDYNAATGLADYGVATYTDGRTVARDFDSAGRLDYAITTYAGGRTVAQDFNAQTGVLSYDILTDPDGHSVAQSYDAAGRLDYGIEHLADGHLIATDYDQADTQPWTTYSITYDALGTIQSTATT